MTSPPLIYPWGTLLGKLESILVLLLNGCITMGKLFNLSGSTFPHRQLIRVFILIPAPSGDPQRSVPKLEKGLETP